MIIGRSNWPLEDKNYTSSITLSYIGSHRASRLILIQTKTSVICVMNPHVWNFLIWIMSQKVWIVSVGSVQKMECVMGMAVSQIALSE